MGEYSKFLQVGEVEKTERSSREAQLEHSIFGLKAISEIEETLVKGAENELVNELQFWHWMFGRIKVEFALLISNRKLKVPISIKEGQFEHSSSGSNEIDPLAMVVRLYNRGKDPREIKVKQSEQTYFGRKLSLEPLSIWTSFDFTST